MCIINLKYWKKKLEVLETGLWNLDLDQSLSEAYAVGRGVGEPKT